MLNLKNLTILMILSIINADPLLVTRENAVPLEEDEYFVADMIGMKVMTEDGTEFGALSE